MTAQYFKYAERQGSSTSAPKSIAPDPPSAVATILNPAIESETAENFIVRIERKEALSYAFIFAGAIGFLMGLLSISGGALVVGILAAIAGAILLLLTSREKSNNCVVFRVGHGSTAIEISRAHGLLLAGSLTNVEARDIASMLWETHRTKQNVDSNRPLQKAISAVSDQACARVEEREQAVVESALQKSRTSQPTAYAMPQNLPQTPEQPPTV